MYYETWLLTFGSATYPTSLLLILFLFLLGRRSSKRLRLHPFKFDRDEIWQECSSSKYPSIDGVRMSI